jgi:serine/threonine protein kinase
VGQLSYLKTLSQAAYTKLVLVKDIGRREYYVEKSLVTNIDFQEQLFENEIKMHSMLDHRSVIRFIEQTGPFQFLMEYAGNGNLNDFINSEATEKKRIKTGLQFLKGLAYLHDLGIAHNDIKPTNILITDENRAKLADFAFAGKIGEITFQDAPDFFNLGTDFFRRPKMHSSHMINLIENDIYSTGVVLYLLFSEGKEQKSISLNHIHNPSLRNLVRGCLNGAIKTTVQIIAALEEAI